jgi:hypothetical protein
MTKQVELIINGKKIPLTEFPEEFIKNTLIGMVSSLKGVNENIETISLTISKK